MICKNCNNEINLNPQIIKYRNKNNLSLELCKSCLKSQAASNQMNLLTKEQKTELYKKVSLSNKKYFNNLSDDEKILQIQKLDNARKNIDIGKQKIFRSKQSKSLSNHINNLSKDEKAQWVKPMNEAHNKWWDKYYINEEIKESFNNKQKMTHQDIWINKSEKYKEAYKDKQREIYYNKSDKEKEIRREHLYDISREYWDNITEEDKLLRQSKVRKFQMMYEYEWAEKQINTAIGLFNNYINRNNHTDVIMQQLADQYNLTLFKEYPSLVVIDSNKYDEYVKKFQSKINVLKFNDKSVYTQMIIFNQPVDINGNYRLSFRKNWDYVFQNKNNELLFIDIDGLIHTTNFKILECDRMAYLYNRFDNKIDLSTIMDFYDKRRSLINVNTIIFRTKDELAKHDIKYIESILSDF